MYNDLLKRKNTRNKEYKTDNNHIGQAKTPALPTQKKVAIIDKTLKAFNIIIVNKMTPFHELPYYPYDL